MQDSKQQAQSAWLVAAVTVMLVIMFGVGWQRPISLSQIQPLPTHMRLDVNTADADALCLLPGIGPRLSNRIVQWRDRTGGFSTINELQNIRGIGPLVLERIRDLLGCGHRVSEPSPPAGPLDSH